MEFQDFSPMKRYRAVVSASLLTSLLSDIASRLLRLLRLMDQSKLSPVEELSGYQTDPTVFTTPLKVPGRRRSLPGCSLGRIPGHGYFRGVLPLNYHATYGSLMKTAARWDWEIRTRISPLFCYGCDRSMMYRSSSNSTRSTLPSSSHTSLAVAMKNTGFP